MNVPASVYFSIKAGSFIVRKTIIYPCELRVNGTLDTSVPLKRILCSSVSWLMVDSWIFQYLFDFQYLQVALPRDSLLWCSRTGVETSSYIIYKVVYLFIYLFIYVPFFLRFLQMVSQGMNIWQ